MEELKGSLRAAAKLEGVSTRSKGRDSVLAQRVSSARAAGFLEI